MKRILGLLVLVAAASLCHERSAAAAALRGEWKFDEDKGWAAADSVAGVKASMRGQWARGAFGCAAYFAPDPAATAAIPDGPAVRFGRGSFSLTCWLCPTRLKPSPTVPYTRLLCKSRYPRSFWTLDIFRDGRVMFAMRDEADHTGTTHSLGRLAEGKWSHLAVVVDRERCVTRYYINGRLDSERPFPKSFDAALDVQGKPLAISTWRKYVGLLDSLRTYEGALAPQEIAAQYDREQARYADARFTASPLQRERFSVPPPKGERQTMWDLAALSKPPKTFPAPDIKAKEAGVRGLFFESVPYRGKPTRVFAWIGFPAGRAGKAPGMVLVHGGGGTAFSYWVKLWVDRGYAAIAMDTCGSLPVRAAKRGWKRHPFGGPPGWGGFDQHDEPARGQWTYHAVAAVVLAHSLLRARPEVDAERIGLTGISWGGYLACIVAGVDPRLRFVAPVYGCGFLGENSAWVGRFSAMGRERALQWLRLWDPSQYLPFAHMPMLWADGTNDHFYPLDSLQKSYRSARGPRTLCTRVRMPHAHPPAGDPKEITAFADQFLKGRPSLAKVAKQGRQGRHAWAAYSCVAPVVKAELNYTCDRGMWERRRWLTQPALLDAAAQRVSADLPRGTAVYYFNLIDSRGLLVSTEHETLAASGRPEQKR